MRRHLLLIAVVFLSALADVGLAADTEDPSDRVQPVVFRPSTTEDRMRGLSLAGVERFRRPDGTKAVRLSFRFQANGRSLFVEHVPLFFDRGGDPKVASLINVEVVLRHRTSPIRFVAIGRDGKSEAETWVLQVEDETLPADEKVDKIAGNACPPAAKQECPACPPRPPDPPYGKRVTLIPYVFGGKHHGQDVVNGGTIDIDYVSSFGLNLAFGYPWSPSVEGIFELGLATYQFDRQSQLLDRAVSTMSFGAGIRYAISGTKESYVDVVWGYDRRFVIRAAGSGFYAVAPFDYPQITARLAATLINPRRWGLVAELEGRGAFGMWDAPIKVQSGTAAEMKLYGVLKHPVARLRFGVAGATETFSTNLVRVKNSQYRFEVGFDWSL